MTKRCIALARVSTDDQAREGISLEAQSDRLRAYATAQGLGSVEVRLEAKSGKRLDKRPVLQAILEEIQAGDVTALLVFKLDRLARNTVEALALAQLLQKHGCRLVSLSETIDTGSAFGTFFYTVLAALAQMERDQLAERTRMALAHKIKQGARLGAAPTGWRKVTGADGKETGLGLDDGGQELVRRVAALRGQGLTFRAVAEALTAAGVATPTGAGRWHPGTVQKLLRRAAVARTSVSATSGRRGAPPSDQSDGDSQNVVDANLGDLVPVSLAA